MPGTIRATSQSPHMFETILPRTQRPQRWMNAVRLLCKLRAEPATDGLSGASGARKTLSENTRANGAFEGLPHVL